MLKVSFRVDVPSPTFEKVYDWVSAENTSASGDIHSATPWRLRCYEGGGSFIVETFEPLNGLSPVAEYDPSFISGGHVDTGEPNTVVTARLRYHDSLYEYTAIECEALQEPGGNSMYDFDPDIKRMLKGLISIDSLADVRSITTSGIYGHYTNYGAPNAAPSFPIYVEQARAVEQILSVPFAALEFVGVLWDNYSDPKVRSRWCHEVWRALGDVNYGVRRFPEKVLGRVRKNSVVMSTYINFMNYLREQRRDFLPGRRMSEEQFVNLIAWMRIVAAENDVNLTKI